MQLARLSPLSNIYLFIKDNLCSCSVLRISCWHNSFSELHRWQCCHCNHSIVIFTALMFTTKKTFSFPGLTSVDIFQRLSLATIELENAIIETGGKWSPSNCEAWQRVAIIVPYRDRYEHLLLLLSRLHPMLRRQKVNYRIFVIEQASNCIGSFYLKTNWLFTNVR